MDDNEKLRQRIVELEHELQAKEKDLIHFKEELVKTNSVLEHMIAQAHDHLKVVSLIQKKLTPTEFPNISGFEFSTKFVPGMASGGDYFDIFEHDDKFKFGILLASSSGYGMSALLLSVLLKITGQLEARKGLAPHKIIELISKELAQNIQSQDHAHLFYGVVDRRNFEMTYCIVGKISSLCFISSSNKLIQLEEEFPPLSKNFDVALKSATITLNPRDRLVLCSEGVVGAKNSQGEMFGGERLFRAVLRAPKTGVHELRNEILYRLDEFQDNKECMRDVTVVVTEVKDKVIKLAKS